MNALLFTDLHVSYKQLDNLKSLAKDSNFDLLLFAGDVVNMGEPVGFVETFLSAIQEIDLPLFWVPGNNDFGRAYYRLNAKIKSLEGKVLDFGGRHFTGVGGSPASWAGQYAGEKMIDKKSIAGSIFLSHVPPPGILNWQKFDPDSPALEKNFDHSPTGRHFSDAPLVHICGHIHHQWGVAYLGQTKVVKLAALERGYYAIMDLENLKVQFGRF